MIDLGANLPRRGGLRQWPAIPQFPECTPLERHVALLLVDDTSRSTIARRLGITRETVSSCTYSILTKLELEGLAGLARLAVRRGYVQP